MCRHNSPQQLRFQPDYLRVTTDVIHKTGECYIGFSTNKPYCTHHSPRTWFVLKPEYMLDKATCLGFFLLSDFLLFGKRTGTVASFANYRIHLMLFYNLLLSDITASKYMSLLSSFSSSSSPSKPFGIMHLC